MIEEIRLRNFRSIHTDRIRLQQLTVIVGANGSGKSNLVKALEFISDIPKHGLAFAINNQGGSEGLIPKKFSGKQLRSKVLSVHYKRRMGSPDSDFPKRLGQRIDASHKIDIRFPRDHPLKVVNEQLTFSDPIWIGRYMSDKKKALELVESEGTRALPRSILRYRELSYSSKLIKRDFQFRPALAEKNIEDYAEWIGLKFLFSKDKTVTDKSFKDTVFEIAQRSEKFQTSGIKAYSVLDPDTPTVFDFCPHFLAFRSSQLDVRRYDLLLNELRAEQLPTKDAQLDSLGKNMATAFRNFRQTKERDRLLCLKDTFAAIAPHIANQDYAAFSNGKEFLEFIESESGRKVESWLSSDGSLRAFAILLAIESAPEGSTLMIEEPEQNLHPWAVRYLMDHIREATMNKGIQVVITTHSQQVLEAISPEELLIASRTQENGTKFSTLSEVMPQHKIAMGEVGRLWVNGLLGGIPTESTL